MMLPEIDPINIQKLFINIRYTSIVRKQQNDFDK